MKTILITGGSRGIGRETAILATCKGGSVGINYIGNEEAAEETVAAVRQAGGRAVLVKGDVAAEADVTTPLRVCHFLAQAAHETDRFRTLEEKGAKKQFAKYEGRTDLGNTEPGDGARYHGRGIFQLTGRANYKRIGRMLNVDLEGRPELALDPRISVQIAFAYWSARAINEAADADDIERVTKLVNGGRTGLAARLRYLAKAKAIWR